MFTTQFSQNTFFPRRFFALALFGALILAGLGAVRTMMAQSSPMLNFGSGRGVQMVDPAGSNQMPVFINATSAASVMVDYTLYTLPVNEFAKRFAAYNYYSSGPVDVNGLTVSYSWQQSHAGNSMGYDRPQPVTFPNNVASGIYVINASINGVRQDAEFVHVGRAMLMAKLATGGQVVAWAVQLHNQTPLAGMAVTLYDKTGALVAQGQSDANGVARLTLPEAYRAQPEKLILSAQLNGENGLTGIDWQWMSDGGYAWWDAYNSPHGLYNIYLYSDRPIYRPGQKIFYQAFLRKNDPGGYTPIASSEPISLTLRDSRNNVVGTAQTVADAYGALYGEFTLADEAPLGDYFIELNVAGQMQRQRLRVEAYRKPEYQVTVNTPASYAVGNDTIPITVAADYFFGKPVAGAALKLRIYRTTLSRYGWYWWYPAAYAPNYDTLLVELSGVTGADGRWNTNYKVEATSDWDAIYRFEAIVTDARNQPVSGGGQVYAYWNNLRLALMLDKYGYRSDEPVPVKIETQKLDGSPAANQKVTVRVLHSHSDNSPESDALPPQTVTTDNQGRAIATFTAIPQGWYRLEASSVDDRGRQAKTQNYLWIFEPSQSGGWYFDSSELSILPDKESYKPGDTAQLLIQSRVQGLALLTLEAGAVYSEQIVNLNGTVTPVNVSLGMQHAPNVFVRVHLFKRIAVSDLDARREGHLLLANRELKVSPAEKTLSVTISANAANYRPGESATLTLQVRDANGQPVQARVGLALVDEALFAVQEDLSGSLLDAFYGRRPLGVSVYDSLVRYPYFYYGLESVAPGVTATPAPTASMPTADVVAQNAATYLRQRFEDTAYWNPNITTDANGQAVVTASLPDNLTTWRAIAKAITLDTRVGEGRSSLLVTQEIIARPALPRFSVVGDRLLVGVVGQNFSGGDTGAAAALAASNLVLLDGAGRILNLPNNGSGVANWTAVASQAGTGWVTTTLQSGRGSDAVQLALPVKAFAIPDRWAVAGQVELSSSERFSVPLNAVNEKTRLGVRLSPSLAVGVLNGLEELIDYPYGCVEQTMSRLLPSTAAAKVYNELGIPNPKANELPAIISQGLQKLYGFQQNNGGWGWFYDDRNSSYVTSYVLFGLNTIQQAGFVVDANVLKRGLDYLDSALPSITEPRSRAFALYVKALAGRGDRGAGQALLGQIENMDAASAAQLALALRLSGDEAGAQQALDKLLTWVKEDGQNAYWLLGDAQWDPRTWQMMASDEKNTALAIRALATLRPAHPLLPKAVRWLMAERRGAGWGNGYWTNTQATSFAILGLLDTIKATGELQSNYAYSVKFNGVTVASGQVTPQNATKPIPPLHIGGELLRSGVNTLEIVRDNAAGSLYYSLLLDQQLYYDGFTPVTSSDAGLSIARSYKLAEGTARADGAYNVGDLVEVTLQVNNPQDLWYVLIQDPIPAGFEGVAERMNPVIYYGYTPFFWQEWGYNRKELRDDRVELYLTQLYKGSHRFTYLMRATTPGEFSVLPATVFPMYNEAVWGRSASQRVTVAPEKLATRPGLAGDVDRSCQITTLDARLTAESWQSANASRDVSGDGKVDLRDVGAVASWVGAQCGTTRALPGAGNGEAHLNLAFSAANVQVGEEVTATLTLNSLTAANSDGASTLGGLGLTLTFDPVHLRVVRVVWNPSLAGVWQLGPQVQNGRLALGVYNLPATLPVDQPLASIVFAGGGVGSSTVQTAAAEAVDASGRTLTASVTGNGAATVNGKQFFLPVVYRE